MRIAAFNVEDLFRHAARPPVHSASDHVALRADVDVQQASRMKPKLCCLTFLALMLSADVSANPSISSVSAPSSVGLYDKYEVAFSMTGFYTNPYDPDEINVLVDFRSPTGKQYTQYAFYYQGYTKTDAGTATSPESLDQSGSQGWRIRFACNETGIWTFRLNAADGNGHTYYPSPTATVSFICAPAANKGFIRVGNARYLKYDDSTPFIPVGNSNPWYRRLVWREAEEYGTNELKDQMDLMSGQGINFFRFEINILEGLNLIGWDFTNQKNYCKYYNQRDAWQLDWLIDYAKMKGMYLLLAVFAHSYLGDDGNFTYVAPSGSPGYPYTKTVSNTDVFAYSIGAWSKYHPYNSYIELGKEPAAPDSKGTCTSPYDFYSQTAAIDLQKKLLRYIIARWGWSSNLLGYELMDEADRLDAMNQNTANPNYVAPPATLDCSIALWHRTMASYLRSTDPFKHLITTAYASMNHPTAFEVYPLMDFTQAHHYTNYLKKDWPGEFQDHLSGDAQIYSQLGKPFMIGEFGYVVDMPANDPKMYELHNTLWATLFNGSMGPASFWTQHDVRGQKATGCYKGVSEFSRLLPRLSEQHVPSYANMSPQGLRIFSLKDNNSDEYYGWVQDMAFTYQNLLDLRDNHGSNYLNGLLAADRPAITSSSNSFTLKVSRAGLYNVKWYNTETGALHSTQSASASAGEITLTMPAALRNTGTFADAAFIVDFACGGQWNTSVLNVNTPGNMRSNSPLVVGSGNRLNYVGADGRIHEMYWTGYYWQQAPLNASAPANVRIDSDLEIDSQNRVYFIGTDNRIRWMYQDGTWQEAVLNASAPANVRARSPLALDGSGRVFFIATDDRVHMMYRSGSSWLERALNPGAPANVMPESDLAINGQTVFFVATDSRVHNYWHDSSQWHEATLDIGAPANVRVSGGNARSPLTTDSRGTVYFVASDNRVHNYWWTGTKWQEATLNAAAPANVRTQTDLKCDDRGKVYFIASDDRVHQYYWASTYWQEAIHNSNDPVNVANPASPSNYNVGLACDKPSATVVYPGSDGRVWSSYWACNTLFR